MSENIKFLKKIKSNTAYILLLAITLNCAVYSASYAIPSEKTNAITQEVISNPNSETISAFTKAMLKEYKKANKKCEYDEAADYLRAALYFLKQNSNSEKYKTAKAKLDEVISKSGIDTSQENRLEIAKNLYLENKIFASAYEFSTLLKEGYKEDICYEYLGDMSKKINTEDIAFEFYKKALEHNPENLSAKYKYACILLKMGETGEAVFSLEDVIENTTSTAIINNIIQNFTQKINENPNDENNYGILGLAYQKLGQYDKTYQLLKKSLIINPNDIFLRYHLGNLLYEVEEYSFAKEIYTGILEDNPYESQIRIARAKSYSALNMQEDAIKDYKIVLAMYPKSLQAQYGLYKLLRGQMPLDKVVETFYPLEKNYKLKAEDFNNLGYFSNKLGATEDAVVFFNKSIQINSKDATPYIELYRAYQLLGQSANAKNILNKAYALFPKNEEIIQFYSEINSDSISEKNNLALSYLNEGDYKKAIAVYNQITPKNAQTYEAMANCYRQLSDFKNAIENYKKALSLSPDNSEIYYELGVVYLEANSNVSAKNAFTKSLQINPKNIKSKKMLAYLEQKEVVKSIDMAYDFYAKKDYMSALKYLNSAVSTYPNDPKVYYYRGLTKNAIGDFKGAVSDFKQTIKVDRNYVVAYYNLAEALEKTGRKKEALYMYEKYLGAENIDKALAKKAEKKVVELGERYY